MIMYKSSSHSEKKNNLVPENQCITIEPGTTDERILEGDNDSLRDLHLLHCADEHHNSR